MLMQRVEQWYHRRECEYPVEYGVGMFQALARSPQVGPQDAAKSFLNWANGRFNMGWTPDLFKTATIQTATQQLLEVSKKAIEGKKMEQEIAEALATTTDEELEKVFKKHYGPDISLPESLKHLKGDDRANAIRGRIESSRRWELLHFERTILLDVLDNLWKDHLYAMDQLRDTINFRAFSQNDPRIEYKREGSQMFLSMLESARLRVTELVFRARIGPPGAPTSGGGIGAGGMPIRPIQPRPMTPPPAPRAPIGAPPSGGMITGPGMGGGITGPGLA
jgi:preprotein translocase subunit SecA